MKPQFIEPQKDKTEYIIGIDFGHGETSAAICRIDNNKDPEDIELIEGKKAIPSTIYIDKEDGIDRILIGKEAVAEYGKGGKGEFYAYFKQSPSTLDESKEPAIRTMKLFMRKVYEIICRRRAGELMEGDKIKQNHVVFIACPSQSQQWDKDAMNKYVHLALDAGLPVAGASIDNKFTLSGIVRESRAAYIRALQKDETKQISTKGILVIDYGSSTIDITYYKEGETPVDKGYPIGASMVEKSIFDYLKEYHDDLEGNQNPEVLRKIEKTHPGVATKCLYSIREAKEQFYTDYKFANAIEIGFKFKPRIDADKIDIEIEKDTMLSEILPLYINEVKNAFVDFKQNFIKDSFVTVMVITGGASRMKFVQDLARDVFGEGIKFIPPQDPSLTVSNGIATAGRADIKLFYIAQEVLSSPKITSPAIFDSVIQDASADIATDVISDMRSSYESFKNQSSDESVVSLKERISAKLKNKDYKNRIQIAFNRKLKSYISSIVDDALRHYVKEQFPEFDFGQVSNQEIKNVSVDVSNNTLTALNTATEDSVKQIEDAALLAAIKFIYDIAALLFAAVVKAEAEMIAAGINGFKKLKAWWNDEDFKKSAKINAPTYEEIADSLLIEINDKNTKLNKDKRQEVYNAFHNNESKYKSTLNNDIEQKLKYDSDLKVKIAKASVETVEGYVVSEINNIQRLIK